MSGPSLESWLSKAFKGFQRPLWGGGDSAVGGRVGGRGGGVPSSIKSFISKQS